MFWIKLITIIVGYLLWSFVLIAFLDVIMDKIQGGVR